MISNIDYIQVINPENNKFIINNNNNGINFLFNNYNNRELLMKIPYCPNGYEDNFYFVCYDNNQQAKYNINSQKSHYKITSPGLVLLEKEKFLTTNKNFIQNSFYKDIFYSNLSPDSNFFLTLYLKPMEIISILFLCLIKNKLVKYIYVLMIRYPN